LRGTARQQAGVIERVDILMRDLSEININDGSGRRVEKAGPTARQVAQVEELVGARLPTDYLAFLSYSNGGAVEVDAFEVEVLGTSHEWNIDRFFHISRDTGTWDSVVHNYMHRWPAAPRAVLPIATDGGGNLVCLDLRGGRHDIVLWAHDEPSWPLLHVADSFGHFIDSLRQNPDYI
jgi:hypothetical protein